MTDFDQLQTAWRQLLADYRKTARGPAVYVEFFRVSESIFDPARLVLEGEKDEIEEKRDGHGARGETASRAVFCAMLTAKLHPRRRARSPPPSSPTCDRGAAR